MKSSTVLKLSLLLSMVGSAFACDDCGPLERGAFWAMPFIGVAPGIWTGRGHEKRVVPLGGNADAQRAVTCESNVPTVGETTQYNVLQQDACKIPKFGDVFTNGVLHVGVQVGRNVCDNAQVYLEFVYDRASGSCLESSTKNFAAPDGCPNNDCNNNSCPTTGDELSSSSRTSKFDDYTAFGGYIGTRHYWNWHCFCDNINFWGGFKFGILHRKSVSACVTIPETAIGTTGLSFAERQVTPNLFCKSNAVSGGLSFGADYCINDCLSVLVGVEVVASCPFKTNGNFRLGLAPAPDGVTSGQVPQPVNIIPGQTGTFVQFPVWVGLRWEFDWCCEDRYATC